jgi:hypothetical protein
MFASVWLSHPKFQRIFPNKIFPRSSESLLSYVCLDLEYGMISGSASPTVADSPGNPMSPPPSYHDIPGTVPAHQGASRGPPPSYEEAVDPNGTEKQCWGFREILVRIWMQIRILGSGSGSSDLYICFNGSGWWIREAQKPTDPTDPTDPDAEHC